jgi:dGTPase
VTKRLPALRSPEAGTSPPAREPLPSIRSRVEQEEREDRDLAPYAMRSSRSRGRAHDEPEHAFRTAYMRDRDRVIHASAFRRLEYKTQVFVNQEGDGYRTRLTHTIEVAQVARTAARALRLHEDLTEAIALSHDVGHGPFGHAGETALEAAMEGHGGFEHNAHGLRVVDLLERRYAAFRGLNLTYEVREAFAMHSPRDKESMGFEKRRPLLEAQLVDVCDNLTYTAHDLDDGIAAGCVTPEEMRVADLWRETWDRVVAEEPGLARPLQTSTAVKRVIDACVSDLLEATQRRLVETRIASVDDVRRHPRLLVGFSEAMGRRQRELSRALHERFYRHPRLVRAQARGQRLLRAVFDAYVEEPAMLDADGRTAAEAEGVHRAVCDRVAAMTDREAGEEHRRLFAS